MRRRRFIGVLVGAAFLPLAVRAQQRERVRRIGMLVPLPEDDPETQARLAAFLATLSESGWTVGRNIQIDYRFGGGNAESIRKHVAELVAATPDVIVADGATTLEQVREATRTVPIVFPVASDPVGAGFVESLARPGGNVTGFLQFEYGICAKWLQLLKEIAPRLTRAGVLRDADSASGANQFGAIQVVAPSLGVEVIPIDLRNVGAIEHGIAVLARSATDGLIVTASAAAIVHRRLIVALAQRHNLPAVYFQRPFIAADGLMSYGTNIVDQYRRAAGYVDRILKGERPADLPVQAPTKYELVINLKTAKGLGLEMPPALLARADEVIE